MRLITLIGLTGTALLAALYIGTFVGRVPSEGLLYLLGVPALFVTAIAYIIQANRSRGVALARGRWWMIAIWIALIANAVITWSRADDVSGGGQIEYRDGRPALVSHGQVLKQLDDVRAREIELWEARRTSSHLLVMLALASLGLYAIVPVKGAVSIAKPVP